MEYRQELLEIPFEEFAPEVCRLWSEDWLLLTTGDFRTGRYNTMTVGWGMFGVMWGRPAALVVVRPQRFSAPLLADGDSFTLTALGPEYREALKYCGSHSGREGDKFAACGLTPMEAQKVAAPVIAEAELSIECRVLYADAFRAKNFRAKKIIAETYRDGDFHQTFCGEILKIRGLDRYRSVRRHA